MLIIIHQMKEHFLLKVQRAPPLENKSKAHPTSVDLSVDVGKIPQACQARQKELKTLSRVHNLSV